MIEHIRQWWRRHARRRMEKRHLQLFGCALYCPRCRELIVDRFNVKDEGDSCYRYCCSACGYRPVFNFDMAPSPICINKP